MTEKTIFKGGSFLIEDVTPDQIFTPEDFSDEQKMIYKTAMDFIQGEVVPKIDDIEHQNFEVTVGLLKQAGELGLLAADVPEQYEGLGLDKISSTLITETMGNAGSFALAHGAHVGIGSLPIVLFGNKQQKEKYLPALASGAKIAAYALTEPGSGSDALGAKTTAVLNAEGTHYILNGTKLYITNAGFADVFVVYAKIDGEHFSAFIVDRDTPGLSTGAEEKKMGIKGSSTRPLILEDAQVPVENLLGESGKGHVIAFNILNIGRYKLAVGCVGSSKRAIELSSAFGNERQQFGKPITSFGLIKEKLADMAIKTYVTESMVYRTGGMIEDILSTLDTEGEDGGRQVAKGIAEYALECSITKVFGTEALDFVVDEGVQIHGGCGFIQEYEIERMYRDSRINRIFEGTNEINRLLIPGTLVRKAMKGELPLLQAAQKLQEELFTLMPPTFDGSSPLEQEEHLLKMAKKVFLMVAGTAVQKFQMKLEEQQEILANVADIIMEVFAIESAILRTQKAINTKGEAASLAKIQMTQVYVNDAFGRIESIARESLAAIEQGDVLRTQLSVLKKLTRTQPINTLEIKRAIAERIIAEERYVV